VRALEGVTHVPARVDPMMKPLHVDRSWRTMEPGGVKRMMERPPEVSKFDLKKNKSKNFKILGDPWLRSGGGQEDRSSCKETVNGGATGG
jgi:hypothetical protein